MFKFVRELVVLELSNFAHWVLWSINSHHENILVSLLSEPCILFSGGGVAFSNTLNTKSKFKEMKSNLMNGRSLNTSKHFKAFL